MIYLRIAAAFSAVIAGTNYLSGNRVPQRERNSLMKVSFVKGIILGMTWPLLPYHFIYNNPLNCVFDRTIEYSFYGIRYWKRFDV